MKRPRFTLRAVGGKTMNGSQRGPWQIYDRERPDRPAIGSRSSRRAARLYASVLNSLHGRRPCLWYTPDFNRQCVLCDEWAEDHTLEAMHIDSPPKE
jgi:hypothetical protein